MIHYEGQIWIHNFSEVVFEFVFSQRSDQDPYFFKVWNRIRTFTISDPYINFFLRSGQAQQVGSEFVIFSKFGSEFVFFQNSDQDLHCFLCRIQMNISVKRSDQALSFL